MAGERTPAPRSPATNGPDRQAGRHFCPAEARPIIAAMTQRVVLAHPSTVDARGVRTLLLATDFGDSSDAATEQAIALAVQLSARLLVVTVIDERPRAGVHLRPVEERERRSDAALAIASRARESGTTASFLVWDGDPAESIVAVARSECADLIVVGTRRRNRVGRAILGSVSDEVIRSAQCPVLVVPPRPTAA
jgi:nucleotide-binding universal stress UspA family protein